MPSSRLLIGQRIALGFAVPLIALVLIGGFSLRNLELMQRESAWVSHTVEVSAELGSFTTAFSKLESAGRGYVIAGDPSLKDDLQRHAAAAAASLGKLRNLTGDNPLQQQRIEVLATLLNQRGDLARTFVAAKDAAAGGSRVADLVRQGTEISQSIERVVREMITEESGLLAERRRNSQEASLLTRNTVVYGSIAAFALVLFGGLVLARSITRPLENLRASATRIGEGDYAHRASVEKDDEIGDLGRVFNTMAGQVQERQAVLADQDWLKTALGKFSSQFQQQRDPDAVGRLVLSELAELVGAARSVLYRATEKDGRPQLELSASYSAENPPAKLDAGEGLLGQAFASQRRIRIDTPPDYLRISSALGSGKPAHVVVEPILFEGRTIAVMELASFRPFAALELSLLAQLAPNLGIVLQTIAAMHRTEELLREAQELGAALAEQRTALAGKNVTLTEQTERLRRSEILLQEQQVELQQSNEELEQSNEELQQSNEEMEEKSGLLANQKRELEDKNLAIERARGELQEQARQLAITSKYKSDFLATMSHELRTPLNSLLILARLLGENRDSNLTPKQVQYVETIASSGADLLEMINQILDLAKIESGTVELEVEDVMPADLQQSLDQQFRQVAEQKHLELTVDLKPGLPPSFRTDPRRLNQVLKNLLANAFKFTEHGGVRVEFSAAKSGWAPGTPALDRAPEVIAIAVRDTGIGIAMDKQRLVFESFQQAEAGTARRFGGTGLGLSISRELANLLGGTIQLQSELGKGSTFTLYLPLKLEARASTPAAPARPPSPIAAPSVSTGTSDAAEAEPALETSSVKDDRQAIMPGDRVILIIEDDDRFAQILVEFAHEKGFKTLVAQTAHNGLALAQRYLPVAITLDLRLSDDGGWVVLDRLKHDPRTRHIPVHVISVDQGRERGLRQGAVSFLQKPVTREAIDEILQQTVDFIERPVKNLLVVEDNAVQRQSICELIGNGDVHTTAVGTAQAALQALGQGPYDCVVVDLMLPDMPGADLIREINQRLGRRAPPVIVYTGKELTPRDETELRSLSESIIVKDARSPERLLDETALFLHRVQSRLPESKRRMLEQVRKQDEVLTGRRVLIVDDDVRNIFALTAALEAYGMAVRFAESGQGALDLLAQDERCDVVLMDVMMPGMDGYETIRRIRGERKFARLPVIAVTAKAMRGDRERCIEAGASDYITKPVHTEKLLSLLRVWLYR